MCAFVQDRLGPNRVGPFGLLQPAADGIKAFLKEEFTPAHVRKMYFFLAPGITLMPAILNLAVIPFGSKIGNQPMVLANLNVGILCTSASSRSAYTASCWRARRRTRNIRSSAASVRARR